MNKRILVATDFSKNALNALRYTLDLYRSQTCDFYFLNVYQVERRELNYLIEIGKLHGTFIRVLHIKEEADLNKKQLGNKALLESILEKTSHSFHTLEDLKVQGGINAFIESRGSDIVAFINRKHSFFGSVFSRPLVKELGYHPHIPIIALNDHSKS